LGAILSLAQQGDSQTASTDLQDLLKTVDPKDTLASNALNALLASLKPAG
jgi:hypothetical protein